MSTFSVNGLENREDKDEIEIDLKELFAAIMNKLWLILVCGFAVAVVTFLGTKILVTPIYESSTKIYVLNKAAEGTSVTASDLQASTQLTKDYQELILSRTVLEQVIKDENLDMTYNKLADKIAVNTPTDTRVLTIVVSDQDPKVAQEIADSVREAAAEHIQKVMDTQAVNTVDKASLATAPSKPSAMKNTIFGGLIGLFLAGAVVVVLYLLDDRIKNVEDVEQHLGIGVLGVIPMTEQGKKNVTASNKRGQVIQKKKRR